MFFSAVWLNCRLLILSCREGLCMCVTLWERLCVSESTNWLPNQELKQVWKKDIVLLHKSCGYVVLQGVSFTAAQRREVMIRHFRQNEGRSDNYELHGMCFIILGENISHWISYYLSFLPCMCSTTDMHTGSRKWHHQGFRFGVGC